MGDNDEELAEDFRRFGLVPEKPANRGEDFAVHPDNWNAVRLFLSAASQWRFTEGIPVGLDYSGVAVSARAKGLRLGGRLLEQLQVMEQAALEKLRSKK